MTDEEVIEYLSDVLGLETIENTTKASTQDMSGAKEITHGRVGSKWAGFDDALSVAIKPRWPTRVPVLSLDSDDLIAPDPSYLIIDPTLLPNLQIAFLNDQIVQWTGIFKSIKPKHFLSSSRDGVCFEIHQRMRVPEKKYVKAPFLWNGKRAIPLFSQGNFLRQFNSRSTKEFTFAMVVIASALEQITAKWSVEITTAGKILIIGAERDDLKELYDMREEPLTESGRRKKILHWVRNHSRIKKGKIENVVGHTRGIETFNLGSWKIDIVPPIKLINEHRSPEIFAGTLAHDVYRAWKRIPA